jgi:hypothetical protein
MSYPLDSPEYDLSRELIVSVTEPAAGRVLVETNQTDKTGWRSKYQLICIDGRWKVRDNKKRSLHGDVKWSADML